MEIVFVVLRGLLLVGALAVAAGTVISGVRTFVVPRAQPVALSRVEFVAVRRLFDLVVRRSDDYYVRDRIMALFAPMALLLLPLLWLAIIFSAYTAVFIALDPERGFVNAFEVSGSSIFTLGIDAPSSIAAKLLSCTEAALGLFLLALLITYLPSMYASFQRREAQVGLLEVRAGTPPSAIVMLVRFHQIGWLGRLDEMWRDWETWFVEVQESHTSFGALCFFRSPHPDQSWITAAGCVLDAAALTASTLDLGTRTPEADLVVRAGFVSLRRIADFFQIPYPTDPGPDDPISIDRAEFDDAYDRLDLVGVPLKPDRDQCWEDFKGWRVNYDAILLNLAGLVMAPVAQWSSDRSPAYRIGFLQGIRRPLGGRRSPPG